MIQYSERPKSRSQAGLSSPTRTAAPATTEVATTPPRVAGTNGAKTNIPTSRPGSPSKASSAASAASTARPRARPARSADSRPGIGTEAVAPCAPADLDRRAHEQVVAESEGARATRRHRYAGLGSDRAIAERARRDHGDERAARMTAASSSRAMNWPLPCGVPTTVYLSCKRPRQQRRRSRASAQAGAPVSEVAASRNR